VVEAIADTEPLVFGLGRIDFLHRTRPLGKDFCVRQHDAIIFPAGFDLPTADRNQPERGLKRPMSADAFAEIASASGCRLARGQTFARIVPPITTEVAMSALRELAMVQQAADNNGPLPFKLTCEAEGLPECIPNARAILAGLGPEHAWSLTAEGIQVGSPWTTVRIRNLGTAAAHVSVRQRVPAPP
jgi:hypothetical protein